MVESMEEVLRIALVEPMGRIAPAVEGPAAGDAATVSH
jgi:hypothetical protein